MDSSLFPTSKRSPWPVVCSSHTLASPATPLRGGGDLLACRSALRAMRAESRDAPPPTWPPPAPAGPQELEGKRQTHSIYQHPPLPSTSPFLHLPLPPSPRRRLHSPPLSPPHHYILHPPLPFAVNFLPPFPFPTVAFTFPLASPRPRFLSSPLLGLPSHSTSSAVGTRLSHDYTSHLHRACERHRFQQTEQLAGLPLPLTRQLDAHPRAVQLRTHRIEKH